MKLIITQKNLGQWAAGHILRRLQEAERSLVLGLPTGSTPLDMYTTLIHLHQKAGVSLAQVSTFNMDEYVGLSPQHEQSYHYYMHHHLFNHVDISPSRIHLLNGLTPDAAAECRRYEEAIKQAGGIDLCIGGVGRNGHIAFNEPGTPFDSRTHIVQLTPATRQANARFFQQDPQAVPSHALTVGIGTILDAKELLFIAQGAQKAEAVAQAVNAEISPSCPITALRTHPQALLLMDPAAAAQITGSVREELAKQQAQDPLSDWSVDI